MHYQIVDDKGNADIPVSAIFIKMDKKTAAIPTKIRYWFNEDDANVKETALNLENLTLTIDVSELAKGEHELHMQLATADGEVSPVNSGSFVSVIIRKGDVNDDGEVNVGDVVTVCNVMAGISTVELQIADVNKDGEVNVGDIVTICNIMAGIDQ